MSQRLDQQSVTGHDQALRAALVATNLPVDDMTEEGRLFRRFLHGGETVGFGGLELYQGNALLRSVVVLAPYRGRGIGQAITRSLLTLAHDSGVGVVYLLTDTAALFFKALGFRTIDRSAAPATILATRQAASLCPASASLMVKELAA